MYILPLQGMNGRFILIDYVKVYNYELLANQAPRKFYLIVNMVLDLANLVTNVAKPSLDLDQDETLNIERPPHPTNQNFFR